MNNKIRHSGIVEQIEDNCVRVRIVQTSACAACKVAGHCNASESKEKLVDVYGTDASSLSVGDEVCVTASSQVAVNALLLGFGVPFMIVICALLIVLKVTGNEAVAAIIALLALLPYYGVLYIYRKRLRNKLAFYIER